MLSRLRRAAAVSIVSLAGVATLAVAHAADAPKVSGQNVSEQKVPDAAPRAAQIEPLVAPVKRVAPQVSEHKATSPAKSVKKSGAADTVKSKSADVPPRRARSGKSGCAAGFILNETGHRCVKLAASSSTAKKPVARTGTKKSN